MSRLEVESSVNGGGTEKVGAKVSPDGTSECFVHADCEAQFKRRTSHVPNLMQMSENNRFFSFALDSAHVKFDV